MDINLKKNVFRSKFRESRDKTGKKTFENFNDRLKIIGHLKVEDVETKKKLKLSDLLNTVQ